MNTAINEALIRDVVQEVLGRLGGGNLAPAPRGNGDCGCPKRNGSGKHFGVFDNAADACAAAADAFLQLREKGVEARRKIVDIVKTMADANAKEWGRIELEETRIGRLDHKIEKLQIIKLVPGVEWIRPDAMSGDHGIMLEEYTPFGVVGAVTPSTHSIPTLSGNIVNIVAAGNAVVFNAHPAASKCAAMSVRAYNEAIYRETGIENIACIIETPTFESFKAMCAHEAVTLLCVTGGPGVVKAAMQTGKRAICAGPGNPPVLVDDTACMKRAARSLIQGASYDNNLLCIGEKEVFVLDKIADKLMAEMENQDAMRLNASQLDRLTKAAFSFKEGHGAGCPEPVVNRDLIGKDASALAKAAGATVGSNTQLLFAETDKDHVFVKEEQMMPFIPVVRVRSIEEGVEASKA